MISRTISAGCARAPARTAACSSRRRSMRKASGFGVLRATGSGSPCVVTFNTGRRAGRRLRAEPAEPDAQRARPGHQAVPVEGQRGLPARLQPRRGAQRARHAGRRDRRRRCRRRLRRRRRRDDASAIRPALAVYLAAQPRPTSLLELDSLGPHRAADVHAAERDCRADGRCSTTSAATTVIVRA